MFGFSLFRKSLWKIAKAKMQIVRVKGINGLGKTNGCEEAPVEVLRAFSSQKRLDFEEIHVNNSDVEQANKLIYENAKKLFSEQDKALFIGGDHSVSYGLVKGFFNTFKKGFLVIFDAHADCMKPGEEPTHEEWLRGVIEEGFPPENIVIIGARKIWPEEQAFLKEKGIKVVTVKGIRERKEKVCNVLAEKIENREVYVSVDIDVIDPIEAPGTSYPEPGGLSEKEMIYFLKRLSNVKGFKGADIVEINPMKDDGKTVKLGARLLAEMV